jgi:hypothetical protein
MAIFRRLEEHGHRDYALPMHTLLIGVVILFSSGLAESQGNIRQVDFKNFTYPLSGRLLGHDRLQWLPIEAHSARKPVHLVNGEDLTKSSSFVMDGREYIQWQGFTLQSVQFANLTGDGQEQAIVVLHYRTGGTQQTDYVYIYSFTAEKPKLLAYFHTGDRGHSGLCRVFGDHGKLVVELFDPEKRSGDCCSSGIMRTRYRWQHGQFEANGPAEREMLEY